MASGQNARGSACVYLAESRLITQAPTPSEAIPHAIYSAHSTPNGLTRWLLTPTYNDQHRALGPASNHAEHDESEGILDGEVDCQLAHALAEGVWSGQ